MIGSSRVFSIALVAQSHEPQINELPNFTMFDSRMEMIVRSNLFNSSARCSPSNASAPRLVKLHATFFFATLLAFSGVIVSLLKTSKEREVFCLENNLTNR